MRFYGSVLNVALARLIVVVGGLAPRMLFSFLSFLSYVRFMIISYDECKKQSFEYQHWHSVNDLKRHKWFGVTLTHVSLVHGESTFSAPRSWSASIFRRLVE